MGTHGDDHWTAAEARRAFSEAPYAHLPRLCGEGPILILAPHPDDESLGCGGLVALAAAAGLDVTVAVLTDGAGSHPKSRAWPPERLAAERRSELGRAVGELAGAGAGVMTFAAPDGGLERSEAAAVDWLFARVQVRPAAVFATWAFDPHPDHTACARIAAQVARRWGAALYAYPVWGLILPDSASAGCRRPCWRLDVSAVLSRKRAAISAHLTQTTRMIDDDPDGFMLRPEDLERHLGPDEVFLELIPRPSA
jgi:LmbE family N-acetylglucosaminyl deacetylase